MTESFLLVCFLPDKLVWFEIIQALAIHIFSLLFAVSSGELWWRDMFVSDMISNQPALVAHTKVVLQKVFLACCTPVLYSCLPGYASVRLNIGHGGSC